MQIPFTKAHGSKNDFLLTWSNSVLPGDLPALARAICDRHTGIGADGWMLINKSAGGGADAELVLYNSDGSSAEMSGNGTRCAAAFLISQGAAGGEVRIRTGAGTKSLRVTARDGNRFEFDMNMGQPRYQNADVRTRISVASGEFDVTILNVGNPQCAVFAAHHPVRWREIGSEIERHARFPNRTNVSFVRRLDEHSIDVLFWERGAGDTMSSGTGSTGAVVAALARGLVTSPVRVMTPAGPLEIRTEPDGVHLVGPAEIIGAGEFYLGKVAAPSQSRFRTDTEPRA